jgi:hypothetical protein
MAFCKYESSHKNSARGGKAFDYFLDKEEAAIGYPNP